MDEMDEMETVSIGRFGRFGQLFATRELLSTAVCVASWRNLGFVLVLSWCLHGGPAVCDEIAWRSGAVWTDVVVAGYMVNPGSGQPLVEVVADSSSSSNAVSGLWAEFDDIRLTTGSGRVVSIKWQSGAEWSNVIVSRIYLEPVGRRVSAQVVAQPLSGGGALSEPPGSTIQDNPMNDSAAGAIGPQEASGGCSREIPRLSPDAHKP